MTPNELRDYFQQLFSSIYSKWRQVDDYPFDNSDPFEKLTNTERVIMLLGYLDGEVINGGFDQWLTNPTGDHVNKTIEALQIVGANDLADVVQQAGAFLERVRNATQRLYELDKFDEQYEALRDTLFIKGIAYWNSSGTNISDNVSAR